MANTQRDNRGRFVRRGADTNAAALEATLAALAELQPEDAAVVMVVRRLAAAVDESPGSAALWREYRSALAELLALGAASLAEVVPMRVVEDDDVDVDDEVELALRTPVGDAADA